MSYTTVEHYVVSPNDSRVQSMGGMKKYDAARILAFCQGVYGRKQLMIIVRSSKPNSLQYHWQEAYHPKPAKIEGAKKDIKIPWETGTIEVDGVSYISDYDLQGVYELRDNGAYYRLFTSISKDDSPLDAEHNPFLRALNDYVRPTTSRSHALFQHGANDDFLQAGRPVNTEIGNVFLAFCPDGDLYLIPSQNALQDFYHSRRISWNYT